MRSRAAMRKCLPHLGQTWSLASSLGLEDDLTAAFALDPETFGADGLGVVSDDLVVFALKPGHASLFCGWNRPSSPKALIL